jgi:hypothetical protein
VTDIVKEALRDGWKARLTEPFAWTTAHRQKAEANWMDTRRAWRDEEAYSREWLRAGASRTAPGGLHLEQSVGDLRPARASACRRPGREWDGQRLGPASGGQRPVLGRAAWECRQKLGAQPAWILVRQKWASEVLRAPEAQRQPPQALPVRVS